MTSITFRLPYPPSANRLWTIGATGTGRRRFISSTEYETWASNAVASVWNDQWRELDESDWYDVELAFFPRRSGKVDVDNRIKPCLDLMTRLGVWLDDSVVRKVTATKGHPSSEPFVVITISVSDGELLRPEDFGGVGLKTKRKRR